MPARRRLARPVLLAGDFFSLGVVRRVFRLGLRRVDGCGRRRDGFASRAKVLPSKSIIAGFQRRGIAVRRAVTLCNSSSDSVLARCLDSLQNRRATAVNKAQFNKKLPRELADATSEAG